MEIPLNPAKPGTIKKNFTKQDDILFYICLAAFFALAIFFRSQGYFDGNISFWWDEAEWATRLITKPLQEVINIRPVGYMFLTKLLVNSISRDETVFRLLSYLSSILAVPLVFLIAKRIWNSRLIILLAAFLTAFNPELITFAKEFKPYALEFLVHTFLILLTLRYIDSKKSQQLYVLLASSILSIFFCYNIVFIFPALYLILLSDAYSAKNWKKLIILIATALIICLALYVMYRFIWSGLNFSREEKYWGSKYDVFYLGSNILKHLQWFAAKYAGLVRDSAGAKIFWPGISWITPAIVPLLIFFHLTGIFAFLLEKKFDYFLLFFLPILTVIVVNSLGLWPFGPFRVNLFLVIYFLVLAVNGIYFFLRQKNKIVKHSAVAIIVILILLQLPVNLHYYTIKPRDTWDPAQSDIRKALETIIDLERNKRARGYVNWETVRIHADNYAYFPTQFYLSYYPNSADYAKALQKLNMKFVYVLSGVESFQPAGAHTILELLEDLLKKPGIFQGVNWYVIGNREAIDRIEPILATMPERIIYQNKFSYGTLVLLLRT